MTTVTEAFQQLITLGTQVNERLTQLDTYVEHLYVALKANRDLTPEEQAAFDQVKSALATTANLVEKSFTEDGVPPTA